ncbi:hypothetical protein [Clostridium facile]|uniref:Phage holin, LL-H family n=1 Tax=Clostridium facile TaxID=2763035 RepID=A0ABR7INM6_9CLOT|nr:hypothetical protein [Clostridium facile]
MDFIAEYWAEFLFGGLATVITAMLSAGYRKLARKVEEHEQVKDGILAILHDRLYQLCQYYLGQGTITPNALKNVEYLYRSYHSLGGNGTGTELYTRVTKLPLDLEGADDNEH